MPPLITCLCPTFRRPRLLEEALACFEQQTLPLSQRELFVCDDSGDLGLQSGPGWQVIGGPSGQKFQNLGEKYNYLLAQVRSPYVALWEDDDLYFPEHLAICLQQLQQSACLVKPQWVWSDYVAGSLTRERGSGRFLSSCAFPAGGPLFPVDGTADFDQRFMRSAIHQMGLAEFGTPTFLFRWHTGHYHAQHFMPAPESQGWEQRCQSFARPTPGYQLQPQLSRRAKLLLELARQALPGVQRLDIPDPEQTT